jgi:hypothetical protein
VDSRVNDREWERLAKQLHDGKCAPFLGAGACGGRLRLASELSREWADEYNYPFSDRDDLARVMRYVTVTEEDSIYVKEMFLDRHFRNFTPPDVTNPNEPHGALARFPIPIYLTTNYDDSMAQALTNAGRTPRKVLCPWYPDAPYAADSFDRPPGVDLGVVYHLHGHSGVSSSLVLTEDDYIQFLIALVEDGHRSRTDSTRLSLLPPTVQESLSTLPLLFVGYSLRDWTFQVLLQGILRALPPTHQRRHVSVQLLPMDPNAGAAERERAERYLDRYFDGLKISVHWGSAEDFFAELHRRAGGGGAMP